MIGRQHMHSEWDQTGRMGAVKWNTSRLFECLWALVSGQWTMQLLAGTTLLWEKRFEVVRS